MRNLLALVGAAVVAFAVVGWLLGWYRINTAAGPGGHHQVTIDLNAPKIKHDLDAGRKKVAGALAQPGAPVAPGGQPAVTPAPTAHAPSADGAITVRPRAAGGPVRDADGEYWRFPGE